jgi:hypothetical protein
LIRNLRTIFNKKNIYANIGGSLGPLIFYSIRECGSAGLPACLLDTRDETGRSHLTELDTRKTELTHISLWTTSHLATVVKTNWGSILWKSLKLLNSLIVTGSGTLLEFSTLSSILLNKSLTLNLTGYH